MGSIKYLVLISLLPFIGVSQSLERRVISSGGGVVSVGGISLSSNIGETFMPTITSQGAKLTQGFEQAYASKTTIRLFLEGYYATNRRMRPAMYYQGVPGSTISMVDTVTVLLMDSISKNIIESSTGLLNTTGYLTVSFSEKTLNRRYYVGIRHRNSIETWSSFPLTILGVMNYDFTIAASTAAGNNLSQPQLGVWAIYTGDMNQDDYIDSFDFTLYEIDNMNFGMGYLNTDLNGDGFVDSFDFTVYELNNMNFVSSVRP